mgnify:CR=1 FL=1
MEKFIEKILHTATTTIKDAGYVGDNLEANYQQNGSIIIENYDEIKGRKEFLDFNKKAIKKIKKENKKVEKKKTVTELEKKEVLKGVKNLKVSKNSKNFNKVVLNKFVPIATLGLIVMTQVMPIVRNLESPSFFKQKTESSIEFSDNVSIDSMFVEE